MKHLKTALAIAGLSWACSIGAVTTVVDGSIQRLGGNAVGNSIFGGFTSTNVNYIPFSVGSMMSVEIDVRSYERSSTAPFAEIDINGDGLIAYFDPTIYLFRANGALGIEDFTGQSSEFSFDTFGDGSISFLDPYLRLASGVLTAGNYLIAIGSDDLSLEQAVAGINPFSIGPIGPGDTVAAFGAYRVTISVVPEPAHAVLLGAGLAGMLAWRRRSQRQSVAA